MDFEVEELSSPVDSQVIIWKLELPSASKSEAKTEGAMRIYTTQRDFVGLAPLVMVCYLTASTSHLIIIRTRIDVNDRIVSHNANTWNASFEPRCIKTSQNELDSDPFLSGLHPQTPGSSSDCLANGFYFEQRVTLCC